MTSAAPNPEPTLSSVPAPTNPAPMALPGMDPAQLQPSEMQAIPGLNPTQLMNLLRHLPGVFTKVRRSATFVNIATFPSYPFRSIPPPPHSFPASRIPRPHRLHVIVLRSSRLRVEHAASHDECPFSDPFFLCLWFRNPPVLSYPHFVLFFRPCFFLMLASLATRRRYPQGGRCTDAFEPLPVLTGNRPRRLPRERPWSVVAPARAPGPWPPRRPALTGRQYTRCRRYAEPGGGGPRARRGRRRGRRRRVRRQARGCTCT
ncbi:hypothetical protein K438DRAFT_856455 [Mycena galopus ATCC 62051]|nr:hypothetical protein K438DRAFT_856455 [Mycena galopus ATCC 62051]